MKKLRILILTVLLLAVFSVPVLANDTYDLPDLKMTVEIPDEWVAITLNPENNEEASQILGMDSDAMIDFLVSSKMYIDFLKPDVTEEIFITMVESEDSHNLVSVNNVSNEQLEEAAELITGQTIEDIQKAIDEFSIGGLKAEDVEWGGYEIYDHHQAKFIKLYNVKYLNGVPIYGLQYYTVQNGKMINIVATSYTSEITDSLEQTTKEVVDSVVFTELEMPKIGINWYEATKSGLIWACGAIILFGGITLVRQRKQKKENMSNNIDTLS